jgi:hypothetical protein
MVWTCAQSPGLHTVLRSAARRAPLLARYSPQCYLFHWGLDTLTHTLSADALWTPGLRPAVAFPELYNQRTVVRLVTPRPVTRVVARVVARPVTVARKVGRWYWPHW